MVPTQIERLVPCQLSAYQMALSRLIEGEVQASESAPAAALKRINNTLMELRTICNHPLIRYLPTCNSASNFDHSTSVIGNPQGQLLDAVNLQHRLESALALGLLTCCRCMQYFLPNRSPVCKVP